MASASRMFHDPLARKRRDGRKVLSGCLGEVPSMYPFNGGSDSFVAVCWSYTVIQLSWCVFVFLTDLGRVRTFGVEMENAFLQPVACKTSCPSFAGHPLPSAPVMQRRVPPSSFLCGGVLLDATEHDLSRLFQKIKYLMLEDNKTARKLPSLSPYAL